MAEHQVTHDGISKEEKEFMIEQYLKEHGLYIVGAPKVHHRDANIIEDDLRYPLILDEDKNNIQNTITNTKESKVLFDMDDLEENPYDKIEDYDHMHVKIVHHNSCDNLSNLAKCKRTGLVSYAIEVETYKIGIVRPKEGLINRTVSQGDIVSIATYDGGAFHVYTGKIIEFFENHIARFPDIITDYGYTTMGIVIDVSKSFSSKIEIIDINTIIDIREKDYQYDFSIYGIDIKKIYTDWVQEDIEKKPNTIAPSDNLKYTRPLPPFSGAFDMFPYCKIQVQYNKKYAFTLLNGVQIIMMPGQYVQLTVLFMHDRLIYGCFFDDVFYEVPLEYSDENTNIKKLFFTIILFNNASVYDTIDMDKYTLEENCDIDKWFNYKKYDISNKLNPNCPYIALAYHQFSKEINPDMKMRYEMIDTYLHNLDGTYFIEVLTPETIIDHKVKTDEGYKLYAIIPKNIALQLLENATLIDNTQSE